MPHLVDADCDVANDDDVVVVVVRVVDAGVGDGRIRAVDRRRYWWSARQSIAHW